jgi:para-aminobenzoate synthetase component I
MQRPVHVVAVKGSPLRRRPYEPAHLLERVPLKLPFWMYYELFGHEPYSFLLDSARDPQKLGRYSFIAAEPFLVFRAKRVKTAPGVPHQARCTVVDRRAGAAPVECVADPLSELRQLMAAHEVDPDVYAGSPVPYLAGAAGYFGYEAGYFVEDLPDEGRDDLGLPDIDLGLFDATLSHCHRTNASYLSVLGRGPDRRAALERAERRRDELLSRIAAFESAPPSPWTGSSAPVSKRVVASHIDEAAYCALVERTKDHIRAGDIFEMCLTHRIESPFDGRPWDLYRELRRVNPAPFGGFLRMPSCHVISSSPERFLRLGRDRLAESRPIKGTRPRGADEAEDKRLHDDLATSLKDQAENNMIVDLVRNDFGRVCKFGTVHVPELRIIEAYATLYQMVSTVRGQLDDGRDAIDLLRACFPGGSMTGAPKIEAMKIIDRLEPVKRSVYSGSIGYLDFAGPVDLNIVIRTLILKGGTAYYNVGGAIVADSDPRSEYQETLDKARALMTAIRNVAGAT